MVAGGTCNRSHEIEKWCVGIYGQGLSLKRLVSNGTSVPDPLTLKDGWVKESESMTFWPPIYLSDRTLFLMSDHPGKDVDFHKRVLNEYKEGKAYRLFDSGWLKEISYQKITGLWMTMREGEVSTRI